MVFSAFIFTFTSCKDDEEEDYCADGEHEWKNEQNESKRKIKQERSCTNPEIRVRECKNCDKKEDYISSEPSGHRYNSTLKVYLQDATCTEDGHTVTHCTYYKICGSEADKVEVLPGSALGHEYVNYVRLADGYSAVAKCIRCSVTSEKLLGLKLDMEGDRSHLSYQRMTVYVGTAENAAEYKTVEGTDNTILTVSRPADYQGKTDFGVLLYPEVENLMNHTYIVEGEFYFDAEKTGDLNIFKGVKDQLNQSMTFLTYDSATKTINTLDGTVYALDEDDFANGVKIGLFIDDANQLYQVYINDKLASFRPVSYVGDYYPGVQLRSLEVTMTDEGESTFGVDNIYLYTGEYPNGFDNEAIDGYNKDIRYGVTTLISGQNVSYKLPVLTDTHTEHNFVPVTTYERDCVLSGYTVYACTVCGGEDIRDQVAAKGHAFDAGVDVAPTCFEAGFKVFTCSDCGYKRGDQTAPANGHSFGDDAVYHGATCTADAYTEGTCPDCGVFHTIKEVGTQTGHVLGDDAVTVKATCSQDGGTTGKCIFCGTDYTDPDSVVKAYGHYDFDFSPFVDHPYTCDTDGYEEHTCLYCGEIYQENVKPAPGHKTFSEVTETEIITKCRNCSFVETVPLYAGGTVPTYEETITAIGSGNLMKELYATASSSISDRGSLENDQSFRFATWKNMVEGTNTYAMVTLASTVATAGGNAHAHIDWGDPGNKAKPKSTIIFEFDAKYPTLTADEAKGGVYVQGYIAGPKTFDTVNINAGGKIFVAGADTGLEVATDKWTKIAVQMDFDAKSGAVYVDGVQVGTFAIGAFDYIDKFRINFNRDKNKISKILIDNVYTYYADRPVYITAVQQTEPVPSVDLNPDKAILSETEGYLDYVTKLGTTNIVYKEHAKFSPVYNDDGDQIPDAIRYQFNNEVAHYGENTGNDTHFTVFGLAKGGTYTIRTKITFNEITGSVALIQGRREKGGSTGTTNPQYNFLQFANINADYGVIRVAGNTQIVKEVRKGDTVDIYVIDNETSEMYDVYIDGVLVLENYYYGDKNAEYNAPHTGGMTYKMFNQANGYDASKPNRFLDINIEKLEFYNGIVEPANYAGKVFADQVIKGEEQKVISFDESDSLAKWFAENDANVPGGYIFEAVEGKSYLSIKLNPENVKTISNIRYVMIDPNGNEVEEGGVWTMSMGEFGTYGLVNPIFTALDGAPINPDTGLYDLTGYKQIKFRFYVKDTVGFRWMIKANVPNSTGSNYPKGDGTFHPSGISYFYVKGEGTTPNGWNEVVYNINPTTVASRGGTWAQIESLDFAFSGWGNTGAKDGFTVYLESVTLVKNDTPLANTGYATNVPPCLEHDFGEPVVGGTATTCGEVDYSTRTCSVCNYVEVITDGVKAHTLVLVEDKCVAATCNAVGYDVYKCEECNQHFKYFNDKTLHDFVLKEDATAEEGYVAATCTEAGQDVYVCANENCNHAGTTFVLPSEALGHVHGDDVTVTEADCENDKSISGDCDRCGAPYVKYEENTKLGHDIVTAETPATCTEDGHITVKCSREDCDYVEKDEDIPAKGHNRPAEYLWTFVERTCATYEGIEYKCLDCGETVGEYNVELGKDPHVWGDFEIISLPTCGQNGFKEAVCEVCGLGISENGTPEEKELCILLATGNHNYDTENYVFSSDNEYEVRTKYHVCTVCGLADPDSIIEVPAKYDATEGLIFTDNKNGAFVITGYNGTATKIVIPATYSGKPVIIGNAFVGNTAITSIEIPEGVTVSAGAFKGCTALASVKLPADMTALPAEIFYGCTALKSIVLPENCTVIGAGAFYGCSALEVIEIKAELTSVQQFAFAGCDMLTTVKYVSGIRPEMAISENGNEKLIAASWVSAN